MLKAAFENSLLMRALERLHGWYIFSLIAAMGGAMRLSYANSATRRVTERVLGGGEGYRVSAFAAMLTRFNSALARFGRGCWSYVEASAVVRLFRSAAMRNSLVYRALFGAGMHRFITVVFALYIPIDWVLREFSPVAALSGGWDEAFLAFGFVYLVCERMFPGNEKPNCATPLDTVLIFFLGVGFLCLCVVSPILGIAVDGLRAVVQYMLWFFVLTRVMRDEGDVNAFVGVLVATASLVALHCIYQYIVAAPIPSNWVTQTEQGVRTRVYSIFGSPNICGAYMIMMAPLAASYAYRVRSSWGRVLAWCAVGLMGVSCLVTFSRGAWLGFAVMVAVFAWLRDKRLLAAIFLAAGVAVFIPQVANRITFLFTDEFRHASEYGGRAGRWRDGMALFNSGDTLFGYGLGRFGGAVAMQNQTNKAISYFYMDNYYLKTLVEMGYVGFAAYILLLLSTLLCGLRSVWRAKGSSLHPVAVALLSAMVGVLVHCYTENIFEVPYMNALFWGMAAVLIFIGFGRRERERSVK